jgi:hypothetical protein
VKVVGVGQTVVKVETVSVTETVGSVVVAVVLTAAVEETFAYDDTQTSEEVGVEKVANVLEGVVVLKYDEVGE